MKTAKSLLSCFVMSVFLLSSCATYKAPTVELPSENTNTKTTASQKKGQKQVKEQEDKCFSQDKWWTLFNDATLNSLENEALAYNHDLKEAMSRMNQAKAKVVIARANYYPIIDLFGQATDSKLYRDYEKMGTYMNRYTVGLSASYEINLWGQYWKNAKSAKAEYLYSKVDKDAVKLMLTAQVAQTYFTVLALDAQYKIAQETLKIREDSYNVYHNRFKKGIVNELDLRRVEAEMESVRAQVYSIEAQLKMSKTSLNVLVGKTPKFIVESDTEQATSIEKISSNCTIPTNVPSNLLSRRPDIKAMEYKLESVNASASSVKAEMFPKISLTGQAGIASHDLEDLFTTNEDGKLRDTWNYSGTISFPVFYGGRKIKNYKVAKEQYEQMTEEYQKTVQNAFKETLDSINNVNISKNMVKAYKKQEEALARSYKLAVKRQKAGLTDLLDLLDVQRLLLQAQMNLVNARNYQLAYIVDVCKALGGGWKEQ